MITRADEADAVLARAAALVPDADDPATEVELATHRVALHHLTDHHDRVLADWRLVAGTADRLERPDLRGYAQLYGGGSMISLGDDTGFEVLADALAHGLDRGQLEPVARACTNLVEFLILRRRWDEARLTISDAVAFDDDHDFPTGTTPWASSAGCTCCTGSGRMPRRCSTRWRSRSAGRRGPRGDPAGGPRPVGRATRRR